MGSKIKHPFRVMSRVPSRSRSRSRSRRSRRSRSRIRSVGRSSSEKRKIFRLLLKHPEYAGSLRWTDPRNPGLGIRWTRKDLDLFISMGGNPIP